jgi:hypothetical protein
MDAMPIGSVSERRRVDMNFRLLIVGFRRTFASKGHHSLLTPFSIPQAAVQTWQPVIDRCTLEHNRLKIQLRVTVYFPTY